MLLCTHPQSRAVPEVKPQRDRHGTNRSCSCWPFTNGTPISLCDEGRNIHIERISRAQSDKRFAAPDLQSRLGLTRRIAVRSPPLSRFRTRLQLPPETRRFLTGGPCQGLRRALWPASARALLKQHRNYQFDGIDSGARIGTVQRGMLDPCDPAALSRGAFQQAQLFPTPCVQSTPQDQPCSSAPSEPLQPHPAKPRKHPY